MRALVVSAGELALQENYPCPEPGPGEALLRLIVAGICSTDLEIVRGYAGFEGVLGHEFVAIVEQVGSGEDAHWLGRRVVGTINIGCGTCEQCLGRGPEHCSQRAALGIHGRDGVFAETFTLPVGNLFTVPEDVTDEEAVFTEPLAAAVRIREQVNVRPTTRAAVVGPGRLGLLIGQVLALAGTEVTMLGRRRETLELPAALGLVTGLVHEQPDDSFDLVVEATGNNQGFAHSLRLVRPEGTLVLKSTFAGKSKLDLTKLVVGEVNVVGSRCGPFAPALRLLRSGTVHVLPLIDARYNLTDALAAFVYAARPGARKVLLRP
ncbi:MAG: MDR/zinc-dependent alcohol dehydrogenase-like family protein [Candidatus Promineifilaceae bacterium]